MPLFLVAIIEPELAAKFQGDEARKEQVILAPTHALADTAEAAKTAAVVKATLQIKDLGSQQPATDSRRWKVYALPFA